MTEQREGKLNSPTDNNQGISRRKRMAKKCRRIFADIENENA
jgi:hypothetical protein